MTDRKDLIDQFLSDAGWAGARRDPLPGDASLRRYIRLARAGDRAILMDAPPETGEDVRPFLAIGDWLTGCGLSAPAVLARDADAGFLLLEDLGDDLVARHADAWPADAPVLYAAATDVLTEIHRHTPPTLRHYPDQMADLAATVVDWYAPEARAHRPAIRDAMQAAIDATLTGPDVLVHRDYHAENLLWMPDRAGVRRIGLLDFQDAMTGPGEYDLASLIHDPRRSVSNASAEAAVRAYLGATQADPDEVAARIAVCSVQRSLRIIGRVFTRLCLHSGRTSYLRFIPPTWVALQRELRHPALTDLRGVLDGLLPEPDADWIADKMARAGTLAGRAHAGTE
ncbi:aminoglycoside phosphotransferase family protein [Jannaschia pohangensis]|uniref:Aminoglycoside phosphotransferase domain-containing protein n=1 Tax=Jannaschia pohangensis TaxID=390807 RepID=A0A1I3TXU7_9RHOB|nr:phosphotransferase [Jannaschia pohangensis]SFJ75595.1 hypothetical protein SAMN04488095_3581 [Jannaschia pohangensis]